eukprot:gene13652-9779_t
MQASLVLLTIKADFPMAYNKKQIETIWPPGAILLPSEIETEREICRRSADRYPKNYYAWMHRLWLLPSMTLSQLEDEYSFTYDWLYMHTSDHSAMHHLIQIIHHVVQLEMTPESEQKPPANEVQEGFESILRAKQVAQAESLESEIRELATARTDVVSFTSSSSRWISTLTSALSANLVLLLFLAKLTFR